MLASRRRGPAAMDLLDPAGGEVRRGRVIGGAPGHEGRSVPTTLFLDAAWGPAPNAFAARRHATTTRLATSFQERADT